VSSITTYNSISPLSKQKSRLKKKGPKYDLDPRIFPPDPRILDIVGQISYIIRCLEKGLSESDIVNLYMDDKTGAQIIIDLVVHNDLIRRDGSGIWKRTEKAKRLMFNRQTDGTGSQY
jgi:hypothetical protein